MKRPKATKDGKKALLQMLEEPPSEVYNYVSVDNRRHNDEAPDCCIEISDAGYRAASYFLCRLPIGDDDTHSALLDLTLKIAIAEFQLSRVEVARLHDTVIECAAFGWNAPDEALDCVIRMCQGLHDRVVPILELELE